MPSEQLISGSEQKSLRLQILVTAPLQNLAQLQKCQEFNVICYMIKDFFLLVKVKFPKKNCFLRREFVLTVNPFAC